jgi:hypothetical protein
MAVAPQRQEDETQHEDAEAQRRNRLALETRLKGIAMRLSQEADRRVGQRVLVEERWIEDLEAYHGKYGSKTLAKIRKKKGSELFITQTRAKTNAMEARLSDMLFPTDDKNWGIRPTPVPELHDAAKEAVRLAQAKVEEANEQAAIAEQQAAVAAQQEAAGNPEAAAAAQQGAQAAAQQGQKIAQEADQFAAEAKRLRAELDEAKRRSEAMEAEIEDQLRESKYQSQARDVIRDGCRLGTGVIKGPVVATRMRPRWKKRDGTNVYELQPTTDPRPMYYHVDLWNYFPDMDSARVEDGEGDFERHLMNKKELRKLARQPGFDQDAIRRLLLAEPRSSTPQYVADLRNITGAFHDTGSDRYHVWEFHGPLEMEEARDLAMGLNPEAMDDLGDAAEGGFDPLTEVMVTVWFCDDELMKFGIHHLDSGEPIYSAFTLEKDEASPFGFGVPYIIRDSQKALNGAWRMLMDNAGLSTGPQIVVNRNVIEPADGDYGVTSKKTWFRKQDAPVNQPAFETYDIPGHHAELIQVIGLAKQNIDEESAVPQIAEGEPGAHPETLGGMAILMNSVNVVFRRIVKNFDDDLTTPVIRRAYDWNMQFSDKEHIKGDYDVDARGTSVLLVREVMAQNLMTLLFQGTVHPVIAPWLKVPGLVKRLVQSMMIPADEAVKTQEEVDAELAKAPPQPDPEMEKLAMQLNIAQLTAQTQLQVATMERDTQMMRLAEERNMTTDELRAALGMKQMDVDSKERILAAEVAVEMKMAKEGIAGGSGGYVSAKKPPAKKQPERASA